MKQTFTTQTNFLGTNKVDSNPSCGDVPMASPCLCDTSSSSDGACKKQPTPTQLQKNRGKNQVTVYYATIPYELPAQPLPTKERNDEINHCNNYQTKKEKYFVWKLLLQAIDDMFGKTANFVRQSTGKWTCDLCCFSLSHGNDVVAVAVSDLPVGVDVQQVTLPSAKVLKKVLSNSEITLLNALDDSQKPLYFTQKWAEKESLFKQSNQSNFLLSNPPNLTGFTTQKLLKNNGVATHVLCVAHETDQVVFFAEKQL